MSSRLSLAILVLALGLFVVPVERLSAETRSWKTQSGTTFKAEFVRIDDGKVVFMRGTRPTLVPFASLSPEDQDYLRELLTKQGQADLIPDVSATPAPSTLQRPTASASPARRPGDSAPRPGAGSGPFQTQPDIGSSPGNNVPARPGLPAGVRPLDEVRAELGPDATPEQIIEAMFGDGERVWRDRRGKQLRAKYVRVDETSGTLYLSADGREIGVPIIGLSPEDQFYVRFRIMMERQLQTVAGASSRHESSGGFAGASPFGSSPPQMPGFGSRPAGGSSGQVVSGHDAEGESEYGSMPSAPGSFGIGSANPMRGVIGTADEEYEEEYEEEPSGHDVGTGHDVGAPSGGYGSRPPVNSLASAETGHDVGGSTPESYGSPGSSAPTSPQLTPPVSQPEIEYEEVWVWTCESCGYEFEASDEEVHTGMKCPNCGIVFAEIDRDGDGTYEEKSAVAQAGFYTGMVKIVVSVIVLLVSLGGLVAGIKKASG
ncbi:hypothetical protein JCM19992_04980 [Thermostilla marina]